MPLEQCIAARKNLVKANARRSARITSRNAAERELAELQAQVPPDPEAVAEQEERVEAARDLVEAANAEAVECRELVDAFCDPHLAEAVGVLDRCRQAREALAHAKELLKHRRAQLAEERA